MDKTIKEDNVNIPKGFHVRPATLNDVKELTDMFNLVSREIIGSNDFTENELESNFQTPGLRLETDTRVIENTSGEIVAYGNVFALQDVPVNPTTFIRVHLDYMNIGLATFLHEWAIERAKKVFDKVPDDLRVAITAYAEDHWQPAKEFFKNNQMEITRHFFLMKIVMEEKPSLPTWPAGIEIKPYKHPEQLKDVYQALIDSFKDHYGYIEEDFETAFERFKHRNVNDEGFAPEIWFLAMDGEKIAGFSVCRKFGWESKEEGYIEILGVDPDYRRKGLATSLLQHSFREYFDRGQMTVTLGVDADSLTGAVDLYKNVGMHQYRIHNQYEYELRPGRDIRKM